MLDVLSFPVILVAGLGGGIGVYRAAAALGFRHGIDWDHIAAITDITSASASVDETDEAWLLGEPGVHLTDESHHQQHGPHDGHVHAIATDHVHEHAEDGHVHGSSERIERHDGGTLEPVNEIGGASGSVAVLPRPA